MSGESSLLFHKWHFLTVSLHGGRGSSLDLFDKGTNPIHGDSALMAPYLPKGLTSKYDQLVEILAEQLKKTINYHNAD